MSPQLRALRGVQPGGDAVLRVRFGSPCHSGSWWVWKSSNSRRHSQGTVLVRRDLAGVERHGAVRELGVVRPLRVPLGLHQPRCETHRRHLSMKGRARREV